MPKSKRNKQVELSKTKKRGMEGKKHLYSEIRSCVDQYANLYIFSVTDMRNAKMKYVRKHWLTSRFFIGKNKVMALALGRSEEEEYKPNLHKIGDRLKGEKGLLFSDKPLEEVVEWFQSHSESDYARSGNLATQDVLLPEGPLPQFPHSSESYLRQLGLPTTLKKGVIHLVKDYVVCNENDVLTPEMARILKQLGYQMAEFQVKIECVWSRDGSFQSLLPDDTESKENVSRNSLPKKRKLSKPVDLDAPELMDVTEDLDSEPKSKKMKPEDCPEGKEMADDVVNSEEQDDAPESDMADEGEEQVIATGDNDTLIKEEEEEVLDKGSLLKMTEKKLEDSAKKPTKYSPKMTRARAAAAKKNVTSQEEVTETKPVRKTTRKRKA